MGLALSCPLADFDDLDFEAVLVRSFSYREEDVRNSLRSLSFNGRDSEPVIRRSYDSRKFIFEGSLSFKGRELETVFSFRSPSATMENNVFGRSMSYRRQDSGARMQRSENFCEKNTPSPKPGNEKYQAAVKLQKCYKSFRTRRRLADCAVIVEQRWWKLLDFAELKRSSISFFDIEKHETAASRWARARTRAAKVGKGLSKDEKARKLALQHWLEAIDPRHRYGHNLQFYYVRWLHCQSKQPFFYWLDIGEGKEVNLEKCPRSKLLQQCIKYLGPAEREEYEVAVEEGKFFYKQNGELLDTRGGPRDAKWIFVLSTSKTLYVGLKSKGTFQHSSFLAGGATLSAGRLVVENGILKAVWPHSGHYLPTEENFQEFMSFLTEHNVDLTIVKKCPSEEEEEALARRSNGTALFDEKPKSNDRITAQEHTELRSPHGSNAVETAKPRISRLSDGLSSKITKLEIPKRNDAFDIFKREILPQNCRTLLKDSPSEDGYETAEESFLSEEEFMVPKVNLFGEDHSVDHNRAVPKEKILRRIDSHKGMRSYQLAQQLSSKWATGAGPRIGCMRDYPSELQFRVLEEANLSPKAKSVHSFSQTPSRFSPKVLTPTSLCREATAGRNTLTSRTATP